MYVCETYCVTIIIGAVPACKFTNIRISSSDIAFSGLSVFDSPSFYMRKLHLCNVTQPPFVHLNKKIFRKIALKSDFDNNKKKHIIFFSNF